MYRCLNLLLFALIIVLLFTGFAAGETSPVAVKGVLDLTSWNFTRDGIVTLDGEWEFFWQHLFSPADAAYKNLPEKTDFVKIPGSWNGVRVAGKTLGGNGFATYRLKVKLLPDNHLKAVRIRNFSSAYTLWINGKIIAQNGIVGKSRHAMTPQYMLQESVFACDGPALDVILQVSNFNHRKGGAWNPISLGTEAQIRKQHHRQHLLELLLFGSLLIMGLYHVCLHLIRRDDFSPLFFALFTLLFALRIMVTGNYDIVSLFPAIPWELVYKTELLTVTLPPPLMFLFIGSLFPNNTSRFILRFIVGIGMAFSVVVIFSPTIVASHIVQPNQLLILLGQTYIIYLLIRAVLNKENGAGIILFGFIVLFGTIVHDILNANKVVYHIHCLPLGVFVLIFSQSFVLSLRFANAFNTIEKLSRELEEKNLSLSRLDRLKDEFLANTSHELRTPLTGIVGLCESLLAGVAGRISATLESNLILIVQSSRRLGRLVNDILDFSRIRTRDIVLDKKAVDIRALAEIVITLLENLTQSRQLVLTNQIPDDIPPVWGDEDRLQQVFLNLIGNALKFTEQGTVAVTAVTIEDKIEVSVTDTGPGIHEKRLERIFEPFEQADAVAASGRYGGTGLGLSITKYLVELHGGEIRVESKTGMGTSVSFTLPQSHGKQDDAIYQQNTPEVSGVLTWIDPGLTESTAMDGPVEIAGRTKILVVEDDPVNLKIIGNHLVLEDIAYQTASNGFDAIAIIKEEKQPDLILLDIMMPGMTGFDVCLKLREKFSPSELPVVMLTARNRMSDLVRGFECGANDYIVKPFSRDELVSRVRAHLKLKEAYNTLRENSKLKIELAKEKHKKEMAWVQAEKAELESLRYQLNPHFILNSLASIRGAIVNDRDMARSMVTNLSEFCLLTLARSDMGKQFVVKEEMKLVRLYLEIERIRWGDYLSVEMDVDPSVKNFSLPPFLLQPVVENAIKYGRLTSPEKLKICITANLAESGRFYLEVTNTGSWIKTESGVGPDSTHIGMSNIRQRLEKIYASDYRFEISTLNGIVRVRIDLPTCGNGQCVHE